jgi:single-strand DNA-binding protein
MGNLTRDPEVRYAPSGDAVGDLSMAVNRRYRGRDGQDREETCFVNVVVWGRQAETSAEYLRKGSPLLVEGRLQYDQWEKDGQKFSRLRVRADRVQFLGRMRGEEGGFSSRGGEGAPSRSNEEPAREPAGESAEDEPPPAGGDDDNLPF